jgi:hypothetical protein
MDQYVVPQFIDVESKIIGPISVRQFIILLVAAGICFILNKIFTTTIFITLSVFIITLAGLLAFAKVNGQSMHYFLLNLFQTLRRPRLTVWHRQLFVPERGKHAEAPVVAPVAPKPLAAQSRLAEVSLMVDTAGTYTGTTSTSQNALTPTSKS